MIALHNDLFNDSLEISMKRVEMRTFQLQDMDRSSKRRQSCCSGSGYLGTPAEEPMKVYLSIYRGGRLHQARVVGH